MRVFLGFPKNHSSHSTGHTHYRRKERPMKRLFNALYIGILTILATLMTASVATASTPLVSANWLADNLNNPELVIIDLRNSIKKLRRLKMMRPCEVRLCIGFLKVR